MRRPVAARSIRSLSRAARQTDGRVSCGDPTGEDHNMDSATWCRAPQIASSRSSVRRGAANPERPEIANPLYSSALRATLVVHRNVENPCGEPAALADNCGRTGGIYRWQGK